jgi:hypothetical protein
MRLVQVGRYIVELDEIAAIAVNERTCSITLRSGRFLFLTESETRVLFDALGLDLECAREQARRAMSEVTEPERERELELEFD